MLLQKIDIDFEKVSRREHMQTKTLYNLLFYIDANSKKGDFSLLHMYCTPGRNHLLPQHTFAAYYQ